MELAQPQSLAYVIEDEVPLAAIYARALKIAGYQTCEINDGLTAMDELRSNAYCPALVVLDLNLPLVSGKEILRFIRMDPRFSKTRVIIATSDSAAVVGELEDKSDLVLLKPISYSQLRDLARRFL
jgi:DNA-binding response OmpR family regulator